MRRSTNDQEHTMGKGDKRSRRGKIYRGSYGKTRPRRKKKPAPKTDEQKAAG
jgi:30S ribosomal protein S31